MDSGCSHKFPSNAREETEAARQKAFLIHFANSGNVSNAAKATKICRRLPSKWRQEDPDGFGAEFDEAREAFCGELENEARRRAIDGINEPIVYQGLIATDKKGKPVTIKRYSDALLMFLMKGNMPLKYRDRTAVEHSGPDGKPMRFTFKINGNASTPLSD